jgi:hypothetical protein
MSYPETLLPKQSYPILLNEDIADCALVRETPIDVYPILNKKGYTPDDIVRTSSHQILLCGRSLSYRSSYMDITMSATPVSG